MNKKKNFVNLEQLEDTMEEYTEHFLRSAVKNYQKIMTRVMFKKHYQKGFFLQASKSGFMRSAKQL